MSLAQAVKSDTLKHLSPQQVRIQNSLYGNISVEVGDWKMSLGLADNAPGSYPTSPDETVVDITVHHQNHHERVFAYLTCDNTSRAFKDYENEVRTIAWSIDHEALLICLDRVLKGTALVSSVDDLRSREVCLQQIDSQAAADSETTSHLIKFSVTDPYDDVVCQGVLTGAEELISASVLNKATTLQPHWLNLALPLAIQLDTFEISTAELSVMEPGALVRLSAPADDLFSQLTLTGGPKDLAAVAAGSTVTVVDVTA